MLQPCRAGPRPARAKESTGGEVPQPRRQAARGWCHASVSTLRFSERERAHLPALRSSPSPEVGCQRPHGAAHRNHPAGSGARLDPHDPGARRVAPPH